MKTSNNMIILALVAATLALGTNQVYAQDSPQLAASIEIIEYVAVGSAIGGALVAVAQGISDSPTGTVISKKKVISAVITAVLSSLFLVNLGAIPELTNGLTLFGVIITYFILGYGTDKGLARLDK